MNPFLNDIFSSWEQVDSLRTKEITQQQKDFLADKDFTVDDVIEYYVSFDKVGKYKEPSDAATLLYYLSGFDIVTDKVGYTPNSSEYLLGTFSDNFYKKLTGALSDESNRLIFSWIPPHLQTDELLINYFTDNRNANFSNFKRTKKPSENVISELMDINFVPVIKGMKKSWWTKKLKTQALNKDKMGLVFMSPKVITKDEIITYIREEPQAKDMYNTLFRGDRFDKEFQDDQEIRAEWAILKKSTNDISNDFFSDCTYDFYKHYLEKIKPSLDNKKFWTRIPTNLDDKVLIDLMIEKLPFEALVSIRTKLSKTQLKALYNNAKKIRVGARSSIARLLNNMKKEDMFEIDMLKDFDKVTFKDLEWTLSDSDLKQFMTPEVVDYYFDEEDEDFFKTKQSMKTAGTLDKKKLYILLKNLSYAKLKSRINFRVEESDFAYLYLTIRTDKLEKKMQNLMMNNLIKLMADGYITVSDQLKDDLDDLPMETTYDGWEAAKDIFMF